MLFILLFLFINNVKLNGSSLFSGPTVIFIVLGMGLFFYKEARFIFISLISKRKTIHIFCTLSILTVFSLFTSIFKETYDYTLVMVFLRQSINIISVILYASYHKAYIKKDIIIYLVNIYIVQACFQMASFVSFDFNKITNIFRNERQISYSATGYRGHAIGDDFFALGAAVGLVFILFANYKIEQEERLTFYDFVIFTMLALCGTFAARTYFIGLALSMMYYCFYRIYRRKFSLKLSLYPQKGAMRVSCIFFLLLILIYLVISNNLEISSKFERLFQWAHGFLFSLLTEGEANDPSLETLFEDMYFIIDPLTFLFGDGYYSSPNGGYYMGTDAGYMRNLLYFGVFGFILLLWHQFNIISTLKKNRFFELILYIFVLIMHIKGDVLGYGSVQKILLLRTFLIIGKSVKVHVGDEYKHETICYHGNLQRNTARVIGSS